MMHASDHRTPSRAECNRCSVHASSSSRDERHRPGDKPGRGEGVGGRIPLTLAYPHGASGDAAGDCGGCAGDEKRDPPQRKPSPLHKKEALAGDAGDLSYYYARRKRVFPYIGTPHIGGRPRERSPALPASPASSRDSPFSSASSGVRGSPATSPAVAGDQSARPTRDARKCAMTRDRESPGIFHAMRQKAPPPRRLSTPCVQGGDGSPKSCGESA
jgi:hypothetical protein